MVSISSARNIRERTKKVCEEIDNWMDYSKTDRVFNKILGHLNNEYESSGVWKSLSGL